MSTSAPLATNPLLFGYGTGGSVALQVLQPVRLEGMSSSAVEIAEYFLEPHTVEEGVTAGFERADLEQAFRAAIVVPVGSPGYAAARHWEDRGWSRAALLMMSQLEPDRGEVGDEGSCPPPWRPISHGRVGLPGVDVSSPISLDAIVRRRSRRAFDREPMGLRAFSEVLLRLSLPSSWLHVLVVVQAVDGLEPAVYRYEPADDHLDVLRRQDDEQILAAVNFQPWVAGSGACAFLVAQWDRYAWRHSGSRAYIDLLIEVAQLAQDMLHAVYHVGAGAWGTPALNETSARELLGIERRGIDALYAVKFGPVPDAGVRC